MMLVASLLANVLLFVALGLAVWWSQTQAASIADLDRRLDDAFAGWKASVDGWGGALDRNKVLLAELRKRPAVPGQVAAYLLQSHPRGDA